MRIPRDYAEQTRPAFTLEFEMPNGNEQPELMRLPSAQWRKPERVDKTRATPRILYISPYWPHRKTCASEIRSVSIARALNEIGEVSILVVDTEGGASEWEEHAEQEFAVIGALKVHPYRNRTFTDKIKWVTSRSVKYPHGCGVDQGAMEWTIGNSADYDMVWFSKMRTANMFPRWAWERSVLDIDDIPSTFERSQMQNTRAVLRAPQTVLRYLSWRRRDSMLGDRFDVLGVCSEPDKEYLEKLGVKAPVYIIPNGFHAPAEEPKRSIASPPRLGFIGIFDYEPNVDGIQWFAKECWPRIKNAFPDARLRLLGRFSDGPLRPTGVDIDGLGWVADAASEIATWSAMVVPIRIGAGTRGKIAQAFSLKCPIVSTPLGAYGYGAEDGREMFLAESADAFANACISVIRDAAAAAEVAERAWVSFLEKWTWNAIRPRIWETAEECLRRNHRAGQSYSFPSANRLDNCMPGAENDATTLNKTASDCVG